MEREEVLTKIDSAAREDLVRHLEELTGRQIRTREDVEVVLKEAAARDPASEASARRWNVAKSITLFVLLGLAGVQYYLLDVFVQIASLPRLTVFVL